MEGGIPRGTQVGSYVIDSVLGQGGMGVVYRAYHPRLERWAAIKVLPPLAATGEARERFEREARAIARLRHRHILSVFDFGDFGGQPYMVVELMPNGSLLERMPRTAITVAQALTLLRPLAEALDYAHAQGVLHRDVKPANVFLDADMQPVLADFGLAKLYSEESMTATGLVAGTPTHMSPEQANGGRLTGATDLYALTVMAFQLVAGRLPFQGQIMEVLYAHVNTPPPAASSFNPALNTLVDGVLARGLAKDPAERWESCMHLVSALEAAAAGRVDERSVPRPHPDVPVAGISTAPAAPLGPVPASPRRGRLAAGLVAAALVVAVASAFATGLVRLPAGAAPVAHSGSPIVDQRSPSPSATPAPQRTLDVAPAPPLKRGSAITVSGRGLAPSADAVAGIVQANSVYPINGTGLVFNPDGSFTAVGVVPSQLAPGTGVLVACPRQQADLSTCIQKTVQIS